MTRILVVALLLACGGPAPAPERQVVEGFAGEVREFPGALEVAVDPHGGTWDGKTYVAPSCADLFAINGVGPDSPFLLGATVHLGVTYDDGRVLALDLKVSEKVVSQRWVCALKNGTCYDPTAYTMGPGETVVLVYETVGTCHTMLSSPIPPGACTADFCR